MAWPGYCTLTAAPLYNTRSDMSSLNYPVLNSNPRAAVDMHHHDGELLSVELLALVFEFCRDDCGWTSILSVCRHWHSVAMHSPCMWTKINLRNITNAAQLEEVMHRSGSLSLDVTVERTPHLTSATLRVIRDELHRIESLRITISTAWPMDFLGLGSQPSSAPLMKKLHLKIAHDEPKTWSKCTYRLSNFVHAAFPQLKELLIDSDVNLDGIIPFPNLREFTLSLHEYKKRKHPSFPTVSLPNLLESLGKMSNLEVLNLWHVAGPRAANFGEVWHGEPIVLPSLWQLTIQDYTASVPRLLHRIVIPPTCTEIRVELESLPDDPSTATDDLALALRVAFSDTFPSCDAYPSGDDVLLPGPPLGLSVHGTAGESHLGLAICPHPHSAACALLDREDASPCPETLFTLYIVGLSRERHFPRLIASLPYALNIRTVNIVGCPHVLPDRPVVDNAKSIISAIASLPAVRRLEVIPGALKLQRRMERQVREVLPRLEEFVLRDKNAYDLSAGVWIRAWYAVHYPQK